MSAIYQAMFGWMPAIIQAAILGLIAFLVIRLVLTIIKVVLDAIPFL